MISMTNAEFSANIVVGGKGDRYLITIPKKLIDAKVIDPTKRYIVSLKEEE